MAKLIAVDLGSHRVKLAVYEGAFGRYQLEQLASAPVPQAVNEAPGRDARLAALQTALLDLPAAGRPAWVTAWPAERTSIRHLTLPFGERAQVEKVLPFEVEGLVPFDMEDMELRHDVLQLAPGDSEVLAAVVERQGLEALLSQLAEAGCDPRSVDIDAASLSMYAGDGVQAVVDLGHSRTIVSVCRDGQLIAARALDGGGRALSLALARARRCSLADAETRKHKADIGPGAAGARATPASVEWEDEERTSPGTSTAAGASKNLAVAAIPPGVEPTGPAPASDDSDGAILRKAFLPQLAELRSTLISFEDALSVEIDQLVLVGGGRALSGLRGLLATTLGVPVSMPDPVDDGQGLDPGSWALARAMGRRASTGKSLPLELREGGLRFKGDLYIARQVGLYGGVFAACALLAGTGMFAVRSVQLNKEIASLDEQIRSAVVDTFPGEVSPDRIRTPGDAMAIMAEKTLEVTTRVETLGAIVQDEPPTVALLRDLSVAMPPPDQARIDVDELSVTDSTITVKAETDGYETATRIESSLQAKPRFHAAQKGDEKKTRGGAVSFKITIPRDAEDGASEEG